MKFTRLRLSGFKSFVEPTELFIEPGLTAIVGPNGCGKSNLFDAMRWVMGETRPSSVRGSEMDDVIFSGSAGRPARNVAEVTLFIDNADKSAGGNYNDCDTIEVSRRIEREAWRAWRFRLASWPSTSRMTSSSRDRLVSAARRRSSASWRR